MVKDLCLEIIQTCPNNCRFCSSCAGMDKDTMISYDTFIKVIDHFMKIGGIEEISFSGGEPFLHPNLFDMIKYCKDSFKGYLRVGIPLLSDDKHKCTAGLDKLVIKYDGTVLPCPAFKEYDTALLNKLGIKTPNVHTDLEQVKVHNGTKTFPLCKKLYKFSGTVK